MATALFLAIYGKGKENTGCLAKFWRGPLQTEVAVAESFVGIRGGLSLDNGLEIDDKNVGIGCTCPIPKTYRHQRETSTNEEPVFSNFYVSDSTKEQIHNDDVEPNPSNM